MVNINAWICAIRPWTLPAAAAPIIVGAAMALGDGKGNFFATLFAVTVAMLIQIGTNFVNDISDFKRGADFKNPFGPVRVIQSGMISEKAIFRTAVVIFTAAAVIGLIIIRIQGTWALIPVGLSCIAAGIFYSAGPYPAAYVGLGEIMVIFFFGPVAAAGTYYLMAQTLTWSVILAGLGCGLICCGILIINNYRDYEADKAVGKKTLPVRLGRNFARWEYFFVLVTAALVPVVIFFITQKITVLIASSFFLLSLPAIRTVFSTTNGKLLNKTLAFTGKLLVIFSILFSIGWLL